ncbi:MAG: elongation factor P [bacterium]|nr:elongation factor P [bacterium]
MTIPASQLKTGMVINYKGAFHKIISYQHQVLGRGSARISAKLKNLKTGLNIEGKFRSDEKMDPVRIETHELEFLYESGEEYTFMRQDNYEQISLHENMIADIKEYMLPNFIYSLEFFEDNPIGIQPPRTMEMKVVETEPRLKGATASASLKPATLETGLVVGVPPFVEVDDIIKVDTVEKKYMERVK